MNLWHVSFPPDRGWLSSCHRNTVWHIQVRQLWSHLSLTHQAIWYVFFFSICKLDHWTSMVVRMVWVLLDGNCYSPRMQQNPATLKGKKKKESNFCYGYDCKIWWLIISSVEYFPSGTSAEAFWEQMLCRNFVSNVTNKHTFYFWGVLVFLYLFLNKARNCGGNLKLNTVDKPFSPLTL